MLAPCCSLTDLCSAEGIEAFQSNSVEFIARRIANNSGDVRRCLELCRRWAVWQARMQAGLRSRGRQAELGSRGMQAGLGSRALQAALGWHGSVHTAPT